MDIRLPSPLNSLSAASVLSLPEAVYRQIRDAILNGVYQPAQMLRQEEIAARLGVSRAPLREAFPRLEAEGLVTSHPRRGYSVRSLAPAEIREIFDLRVLVEESAAYFATKNRSPDNLATLTSMIERMEALAPRTAAEIATWSDLNFQFHDYLLSLSGRTHFRRVAENLRSAVEPYIRVEIAVTGQLDEAHSDHRQIVEAFAAGDAAKVARLTREHCEHTATRLIDGLTRSREERRESVRGKEDS
jgi:DNA-binding GntR family transcriptional regulator